MPCSGYRFWRFKLELNGIILLDKPCGKTSHDMVYELRRLAGTRRVGHTGTLDPLATGVLPMCIGSATKASDMLMSEKKEYIAELILGAQTDTGDCEGKVLFTGEKSFPEDKIKDAVLSFKGEQLQIPPMYSAKKQGGKKLYELAREGITIEREPVPINIYSIEALDISKNCVTIRVCCSKGTYIRVLCEDIGKKLGTYAYMNKLRRISSGEFNIDNCKTPEELKQLAEENRLHEVLIPVSELFDYKKITLSEKQSDRFKSGVFVSHPGIEEGILYRVFDDKGEFFAVAVCVDGRLRIKKSFRN